MSLGIRRKKSEHAGAKNGGGHWGTREEAKRFSKKARRVADKAEVIRGIPKVTPPDGCVFEDLGFSKSEALIMRMKGDLRAGIMRAVRQRNLSHPALAKLLGVAQARLSELMRSRSAPNPERVPAH